MKPENIDRAKNLIVALFGNQTAEQKKPLENELLMLENLYDKVYKENFRISFKSGQTEAVKAVINKIFETYIKD